MPRNNGEARRAQRRINALMQSRNPNLVVIAMMAKEMGERQADVVRTGNTPERLMVSSHFPGHEPGCTRLPAVCYAVAGR